MTLSVKQLINAVKNDEYWKFLIYNNPSFATKNFAEVCLDIGFDFKFRDFLILIAIISQKQTLATMNSLKVVEIILSKIWKVYHAPTHFSNSGWLVRQNTFFVSLTLQPISSQCSIYVETRWLICTLNVLPKLSIRPILLADNLTKMDNFEFSNRPHVGQRVMFGSLLN